jgi:hypothetical protein
MRADLLHVVTVMANPVRWESRLRLYRQFEQHMLESGVHLTTVECALGDRPFELDNPHVNHVKVRHKTLLWNKENLLNLGIAHLPHDWKYVATNDADIMFRRPDWACETVHALQQYAVIQPWSDCYDLGPHGEHVQHHRSFCRQYHHGCLNDRCDYDTAHPGYAWAYTRRALEETGGLIETASLGAGDRHMSFALIGCVDKQIAPGITEGYKRPLFHWQKLALQHINRNIGYLPGTLEHFWHGRKQARKYWERWQILVKHKFDPAIDLKRNTYGVLELAGNKPGLAHALDHYFRERDEDGNIL